MKSILFYSFNPYKCFNVSYYYTHVRVMLCTSYILYATRISKYKYICVFMFLSPFVRLGRVINNTSDNLFIFTLPATVITIIYVLSIRFETRKIGRK